MLTPPVQGRHLEDHWIGDFSDPCPHELWVTLFCPVAAVAYLEVLHALSVVYTIVEVLPAHFNKSRNLDQFSCGKTPDSNHNPELSGETL